MFNLQQTQMILYIKNMVCQRCIMTIKSEFEKIGLNPMHVSLGEVTLSEKELDSEVLEEIDKMLMNLGFERIDDKKAKLIEDVKSIVIQQIHHTEKLDLKINWSDLFIAQLKIEYNSLSGLFSSVEGVTIEHYIIRQKIERVKELLVYNELNLSEISYQLGYSSVAHLSSQFKKTTGLTPSEFKKNHQESRKPIDKV